MLATRSPSRNSTTITSPDRLDIVITGSPRSGMSLICAALDGAMVCHQDLFHTEEAIRRVNHEKYFGPSQDPVRYPGWLTARDNPRRYLAMVLGCGRGTSRPVGVCIPYEPLSRHALLDAVRRCALVHVIRNPLLCFVSLRQAVASGIWSMGSGTRGERAPMPIRVEMEEVVPFVRDQMAIRRAIQQEGAIEIPYAQLLYDYEGTAARLRQRLRLPGVSPAASGQRLRNRMLPYRVTNWGDLCRDLPSDVRVFTQGEMV